MEKILRLILEENITPTGLFILYSKFNNVENLPIISEGVELKRLQNTGYLDDNYKLLSKAYSLLIKIVKQSKSSDSIKITSDFINKYNDLFPKGKRKGASILYRSNPKELTERFTWFFKTYPEFTESDVIDATIRYVKPFNDTMDYTYMQSSKYFIKKEDKNKTVSSTLADLCYNKEDIDVNDGTLFYDSVKENNIG